MEIIINNKKVEAKPKETILEVARRNGVDIPTLCHIEELTPNGACRLCVVEVDGFKNLVPSCSQEVSEGMNIKTHSTRVLIARKTIVELLLANHPDDCLYCFKNGECELQNLAEELSVRERRYKNDRKDYSIDTSSVSIVRDPSKCILCGRCVRICEEVQGVSTIDFINRGSSSMVAPAYNQGLNLSSCVNCGQCVKVCPTGALTEKNQIKEVTNALMDPNKFVVVQHAPSVSVSLGEYFGYPEGTDVCDVMTACLRKMNFDRVFDTSFSADLTIMEEASELIHRIQNKGKLPLFTSCSPAWVKFLEQFYPEFIDNVSSCKSPQQMLGAVIKSFYAKNEGIDPKNIYVVSIMPCTAKKFEASRPEMINDFCPDIDAVLTTRELAKLFKIFNIDMNKVAPEEADTPFGERSSAGKLFGASGGVMEAAIRSAYYFINKTELKEKEIKELREEKGIKEAIVDMKIMKLKVAVVSGLSNARKVLDDMKAGKRDYHFIEVMSCPGGCINGGGQPYELDKNKVKSRMSALYKIDKEEKLRTSHNNPSIVRIYKEFLKEPLSKVSHKYLHTHYKKRNTKY